MRVAILRLLIIPLLFSQPGPAQSGQTDLAIEQANPQRTGVYPPWANDLKGEIAWESSKLFVMKRGSYSFGKTTTLETGSRTITFLAVDMFWPNYGVGYSDPVVAGDTIYFSVNIGDGHLFALDIRTGKGKWRSRREKGEYSPPTVAGSTLYVGADSGYFYAVDLRTTKEKWRHVRSDQSRVEYSPIVDHGLVYYAATNGMLYVLNADTGELVWSFGTKSPYLSAPALGEGGIYFSAGRELYGLDARSGKEIWKVPVTQGAGTLVVANGLIYFRDFEGRIRSVDEKTGQTELKPAHAHRASTRLAIDGSTVYFAGWLGGTVYAVDAMTGETRWKFAPGVDCHTPVVSGENVYFFGSNGRLYALDKKTGKRKWSSTPKTTQMSAPVVSSEGLYFISDDGKVHAVR